MTEKSAALSKDEILNAIGIYAVGPQIWILCNEDEDAHCFDGTWSWRSNDSYYDLFECDSMLCVTKPLTAEDALKRIPEKALRRISMKEYSQKVQKAVDFATEAHEGQCRKGTDTPYIVHPLEVLDIVSTLTDDEDVLCAAVLHDVVEDTERTSGDIREAFGARVAALVLSESEDKQKERPAEDTWRLRKQATIDHLKYAAMETRIICLGDKLSNARAIVKDYEEIGDELWERFNAGPADIAWYYSSIAAVLHDDLSDTVAWKELSDCLTEPAFLRIL